MTPSFARHIAFLVNGLFILSLLLVNVEFMSAERLVHDFQHEHGVHHNGSDHLVVGHHHDGQDDDDGDDLPVAASEHQLLHSIDQLQFFNYPLVTFLQTPVLLGVVPVLPDIQPVPLSTFDPPFRPPRSDLALV